MLQLLRSRRSCRHYRVDLPIEDDKIKFCLEAARSAPSACNSQPWRFVIVREEFTRREICAKGFLPGISMPWAVDAPVVVALCADLSLITHKIAPVISNIPYYMIDIGIAGEHFVLAAESLGLGTCWIGWINEKTIRKILSIPSRVRVLSIITLGYPAKTKDQASERLPAEKISFNEKWNGGNK